MDLRIEDWNLSLHSSSHPRELMVEITTDCNAKCLHCFRFSIPDFKPSYMDEGLFKRLLHLADEAGVERIVFSGWGEPTTHPSLLDFIREIKSRGKSLVLNTNGLNLSDIAKDLVNLSVDEVVVSLLSLKGVLGIRELRSVRLAERSSKPLVKAIFTITKLNLSEVKSAVSFAKELGIREVYFSYYIPYAGEENDLDSLSEEVYKVGLADPFEDLPSWISGAGVRFAYPGLSPRFARACPFASNRALFVRCDGAVFPCLYFSRSWRTKVLGTLREIREFPLGSLSQDSLMDIWRGKYSEMLFRLTFNYLPSCLECPFKGGCSFTLSNESDCWGGSPNCAHCPYLHRLSHCPL